jgi:hypothetical protein
LSWGRSPAASRIFAGKAMSPRPDMVSVAFIVLVLQKCRKTAITFSGASLDSKQAVC